MVTNSAVLAALVLLFAVFWVGGEMTFLAPYKRLLLREHGVQIGVFLLVVFVNLFALFYGIARLVFLKDTGVKLHHFVDSSQHVTPSFPTSRAASRSDRPCLATATLERFLIIPADRIGLVAMDGLRSMSCRINTSASPRLWQQLDPPARGSLESQRWGQTLKGHVAPFGSTHRNRGRCLRLSAARSDAPRHLVGAARLCARGTTGGDGEGRRRCAAPDRRPKTAERAGATPPPGLLRSPGSDPEGGRSCPLFQTADRRRDDTKASIHVSVPSRIAPRNVTLI
jgi:hypothetical protein